TEGTVLVVALTNGKGDYVGDGMTVRCFWCHRDKFGNKFKSIGVVRVSRIGCHATAESGDYCET
ncbi:MAG: hypothetical protein ACREOZ_01325, partial [Gloeomargaritales cyanobacterium]